MIFTKGHRLLSFWQGLILFGAIAVAVISPPAALEDHTAPIPRGLSQPTPALPLKQTAAIALRRAPLPGPYPVEIIRILDGDTFEARVRVWFGQEITTLVRIRGIDAPELKGRCGDELRGAEASRDALAKLLAAGAPMLRDVALDKYGGRVVASVAVSGAVDDISAAMIASGRARAYGGGRRDTWCALPQARG